MPERDFPIGHPAASDYDGRLYIPPRAPYGEDFPPGHPARDGKNAGKLDSPDGMRAAHNSYHQDLLELGAIAALPPVLDPDTNEPIALTPQQLALIYAVRNSLSDPRATEVTDKYSLDPKGKGGSGAAENVPGEQDALNHFMELGYSAERAKQIFAQYVAPLMLLDVGHRAKK